MAEQVHVIGAMFRQFGGLARSLRSEDWHLPSPCRCTPSSVNAAPEDRLNRVVAAATTRTLVAPAFRGEGAAQCRASMGHFCDWAVRRLPELYQVALLAWCSERVAHFSGHLEERLSEWPLEEGPFESAADSELLEKLQAAEVQSGQVLAIDAHNSALDSPAQLLAVVRRKSPGRGPLDLRCAVKRGDSWAGLYAWAAQECAESEVVSVTGASSREGKTLLLFLGKARAQPLRVLHANALAGSWNGAADYILQELERLHVQRGQLLSLDAHNDGPEAAAQFSALYSPDLPGEGLLRLQYRGINSEIPWPLMHQQSAVRATPRCAMAVTGSSNESGRAEEGGKPHAVLMDMLKTVHKASQQMKQAVGDCPVFQEACPFKNCVTSSGTPLALELETRAWGLLQPDIAEAPVDGLAKMLKEGTLEAHKAAESVHFVREFIRGRVDRQIYAQFVVNLFHIYRALEEALEANAEHVLIESLHFPDELERTETLRQDAEFYLGSNWQQESMPSRTTREYVARLQQLRAEAPELLVPHAYTRYLGDLSGGQLLRRAAVRGMKLPEDGSGAGPKFGPTTAEPHGTPLAAFRAMEFLDESEFTGPAPPGLGSIQVQALSVCLPGSGSPEALWALLVAGTETQTEVALDRWDVALYYAPDVRPGSEVAKSNAKHGAFLAASELAMFDFGFFGVSEEEAEVWLPEQRLVLRTGFDALQQAGAATRGARVGVYVGDCSGESQHHVPLRLKSHQSTVAATGSRLSYLLGLRGEACSFDTACSSSLVALGHAHGMRSDRTCAGALVLGVRVLFGPEGFVGLGAAGFLGVHGRCLTFDGSANGFGRGEGCSGIFLCKDPEDGDVEMHLASLLGTAVNQDGRSASLTAPNGPSQQSCIRDSLALAGIDPATISLAECHGTGTSLGDPIEVGAARVVMQKRDVPLSLTSSKSNIGHAEAAAGLNGLVKCVLALLYSVCPPNVHLRRLNAHIDIDGFPCLVGMENVDVIRNSQHVGVSSFGFGGTNARADLWGYCQEGFRGEALASFVSIPCPSCGQGMCRSCGRAARFLDGHACTGAKAPPCCSECAADESDESDLSSVRFYSFRRVPDAMVFKNMYRARMDSLRADSATADRMVQEANYAFFLNTRIFQELDSLAGFEAEPVPPPAPAPAAAAAAEKAAAAGCPFASLAAAGLEMPEGHPAPKADTPREIDDAEPEVTVGSSHWRRQILCAVAIVGLCVTLRAYR
ncbi:unnamed protein product [Effrenium voratum]|nr:unnamed protein product [Effrenium voratum]